MHKAFSFFFIYSLTFEWFELLYGCCCDFCWWLIFTVFPLYTVMFKPFSDIFNVIKAFLLSWNSLHVTICRNVHSSVTFLSAICKRIVTWCEIQDHLSLLPALYKPVDDLCKLLKAAGLSWISLWRTQSGLSKSAQTTFTTTQKLNRAL